MTNKSFEEQDPYLWLEEVEGEKPLQFAREENEKTLSHFRKNPRFAKIENEQRKILLAKDRVPMVRLVNGELFNFWQDETNQRGLWRKTTIASFQSGKPKWDVILDLDALAKSENENWVWRGASFLDRTYDRALLGLSRGGKDATVTREFDLKTKKFVTDGYYVPEAKTNYSWISRDEILVATDFGPGSLTTSGYARIVKRWKRGTPLSTAVEVHSVNETDMSAYSWYDHYEDLFVFTRRIGFYESEVWLQKSAGPKLKSPMPKSSEYSGVFKGQVVYQLKSDFKGFKTGSLVSFPLAKLAEGEKALEALILVAAPTATKFYEWVRRSNNYLLIPVIDNILAGIQRADFVEGQWVIEDVKLGSNGMVNLSSVDENSDKFTVDYVDFLNPSTVYVGDAAEKNIKFEILSRSPERFDSQDMTADRFAATSKDGTKIPYFVVRKKSLKFDGQNPTMLDAYGGFQWAAQPYYLSTIGKTWIEEGGVYVLANLRGGGEFGPAWHQAVLKENRYKVYEDHVAIAEDLIARKITSPKHLGMVGRSNGGLLVGATMVKRPDLYGAVICGVPLLDMLRYHKLLAGASWMDEYGDPDDPKMREAILKYSPYQRVEAQARYPEVLFMTSTKDDRVHPGHARKMVKKMKDQGHKVFYYENIDGGHGGSANLEEKILWNTLETVYLWEKLSKQ